MTEADFALLARLRDSGIKSAKLPIGEFEFFPLGPAVDESPDLPADGLSVSGPEQCHCTHDETEHAGDGYCLRGCSPAQCAGKQTERAEA